MAGQGEKGIDAVVRDAALQNEQQPSEQDKSEFDAIARVRGASQEKMANVLAGHLHSHGQGNKGDDPASDQLHKSSDEARGRVLQANDQTYDAIEAAKRSVQRKFEEGKEKRDSNSHATEDNTTPNSYTAINEAKEKLKEKFGYTEPETTPDAS